MLKDDAESGSPSNLRWQEELAKDSQRIAKAGSFRMALIQYHADLFVFLFFTFVFRFCFSFSFSLSFCFCFSFSLSLSFFFFSFLFFFFFV
jgi:hypothetical protein